MGVFEDVGEGRGAEKYAQCLNYRSEVSTRSASTTGVR